MAKVTYHPEPGTPVEHTQFGIKFGAEPVEVTGAAALAKFRGNPFYTVEGDDAPGVPEPDLEAKHKGRGVYSVLRGSETIVEGLTGDEAKAFNAMTDAEKDEFVAAALADPAP